MGFIGFIGFTGFVGFVGFTGFMRFVGFHGLTWVYMGLGLQDLKVQACLSPEPGTPWALCWFTHGSNPEKTLNPKP